MGGGGKISSEASYIYERSELRVKRVKSEVSYERSELRAKRVMSEVSINELGVRGCCKSPEKILEFRTPESESERNLTNYFIIFFVTFLLRIFWKIFVYDYRSNLFQIFEDNNEAINNICKSNTQQVNN